MRYLISELSACDVDLNAYLSSSILKAEAVNKTFKTKIKTPPKS